MKIRELNKQLKEHGFYVENTHFDETISEAVNYNSPLINSFQNNSSFKV
jgi:hypothetical protein